MDKEKAEMMLAFSEWLDREMDGYLLLSTKDGKTSLISNGEEHELKAALATAIAKYPNICKLFADAFKIADYLNNKSQLN